MEIFELNELRKAKKFTNEKIYRGDHFDIQVYSNNVKQKDVTVAWAEDHSEPARVYYLSTGKEIWEPYICHNWSVRLVVKPRPITPKTPPITSVAPPTVTQSGPPSTVQVPTTPSDGPDVNGLCEAIMGGGVYQDAHGADHKGGYWWVKGRCYPFQTALKNGLIVRTGVAATYLGGGGDDRGFNYNWNEYAYGPSFNLIGDGWDANIDLMYGKLYNDGDFSQYRSRQTDSIFLTSIHYNDYHRRNRGELLFPKWEANAEWRHILNSEFESSWEGRRLNESPNKNGSAEFTLTQYLYDYKFGNGLRVSPWIKGGLGYEQNGDDTFWSIMPGASFGMDDIDILHVGVIGYKQMINDSSRAQVHPIAVTFDLGNGYKALRKSKISRSDYKELLPRTTSVNQEQSPKVGGLPASLQMVTN
jgi:hypothetical protein